MEIDEQIPNWMLDRQTREVGLRGVAVARAILNKSTVAQVMDFKPHLRKFKTSSEER